MKQLLSIMLVCVLFSCSNDSDQIGANVVNLDIQKQKVDQAENDLTDYLSSMQSDVERRKRYSAEVNQKPNDKDWRLECFRKHYGELSDLMENVKAAHYELDRQENNSSDTKQKID
ncbi:MAG: hypothetical protein AAGA77_19645 [Bacteroidota bacterium]